MTEDRGRKSENEVIPKPDDLIRSSKYQGHRCRIHGYEVPTSRLPGQSIRISLQ